MTGFRSVFRNPVRFQIFFYVDIQEGCVNIKICNDCMKAIEGNANKRKEKGKGETWN